MTLKIFNKSYKGGRGVVTMEKLNVDVHLLEAREKFGRLDVLVAPVAGSGKQWVSDNRIVFQR